MICKPCGDALAKEGIMCWWRDFSNKIENTYGHVWGFPAGSMVKNLPLGQAGDLGSIPGSERSPGEGNGNPFQ